METFPLATAADDLSSLRHSGGAAPLLSHTGRASDVEEGTTCGPPQPSPAPTGPLIGLVVDAPPSPPAVPHVCGSGGGGLALTAALPPRRWSAAEALERSVALPPREFVIPSWVKTLMSCAAIAAFAAWLRLKPSVSKSAQLSPSINSHLLVRRCRSMHTQSDSAATARMAVAYWPSLAFVLPWSRVGLPGSTGSCRNRPSWMHGAVSSTTSEEGSCSLSVLTMSRKFST
mmetsp:Transcript_43283/g.97795  ORF Transcript_43283/g.97795 Transcript_43283/m.97795 type:complete len:230 (+) Transcript_43283:348-1037(+)